jgi:replication-associated recombination protein RarA
MIFGDLILHPKTRAILTNYLKQPSHALLLVGDSGMGLGTIARALAKEIAGASVAVVKPHIHDKQKTPNINVDDIRELGQFTRDRRSDALCIVVDEAEKMTNSAPETFLKALEEPVQGVFYILTTHSASKLPATIKSRTQTVEILPPPSDLCEKLFQNAPLKLTAAKRTQITFLADRKPAEIVRLLSDEEYFRTASFAMTTAKDFVQGEPAKRLEIVANTTSREAAIVLAKNVAKLLSLTTIRTKDPKSAADNLNTVSEVIDNLTQNGNARAQLMYLALNI